MANVKYRHLPVLIFLYRKKTSILNIRMQNRMMQLRKCVNHPYLLEFPLTSDGDFKIDEDIVANSGKMMLLDRMLPALLRDGHKVIELHLIVC